MPPDEALQGSIHRRKECGMKRAAVWWLGVVTAVAVVSCGTSMKVTSSWKDPGYSGTPFQKILVVGLSRKETVRRTFESEFVTQLGKHGVSSVPSATTLPAGSEKDRELLKQTLVAGGYDGVIVTRLVDMTKETTYVPGTAYAPSPYYGGFYSYYYTAYPAVYDPGYLVESTIVQIETNLYDIRSEKLVWSGISEVVDPQADTQDIRSFSIMVGERMAKDGIIPAQMKP
jgi:hypothetical protein